jgi:hypothetical protein
LDLSAVSAASIQMHTQETLQAVSISMLRKMMQSQQTEAAALIEQLEAAAPPAPERLLDIHI